MGFVVSCAVPAIAIGFTPFTFLTYVFISVFVVLYPRNLTSQKNLSKGMLIKDMPRKKKLLKKALKEQGQNGLLRC